MGSKYFGVGPTVTSRHSNSILTIVSCITSEATNLVCRYCHIVDLEGRIPVGGTSSRDNTHNIGSSRGAKRKSCSSSKVKMMTEKVKSVVNIRHNSNEIFQNGGWHLVTLHSPAVTTNKSFGSSTNPFLMAILHASPSMLRKSSVFKTPSSTNSGYTPQLKAS